MFRMKWDEEGKVKFIQVGSIDLYEISKVFVAILWYIFLSLSLSFKIVLC